VNSKDSLLNSLLYSNSNGELKSI